MASSHTPISRRALLGRGLAAGAALTTGSAGTAAASRAAAGARTRRSRPPSFPAASFNFDRNWRFGGQYRSGSQFPGASDAGWARVTIPHTVVPLSWGGWNPGSWERLWIYRKHFPGAALAGAGRTLLDFDGVMTDATVFLNGLELATHRGGYLPFTVELTGALAPGENVLAVMVDGRWLDSPPEGNVQGASSVDYLQPAGIYRDATLRHVPDVFIAEVFAKPTNVLDARPGVAIEATIDALTPPGHRARLTAELLDGQRRLGAETVTIHPRQGRSTARLALSGLRGVTRWSPASPKLYSLRVTLSGPSIPSHTTSVRIGFREARFELDGLYLNGGRVQVFGLDRHQLFPYTGMAAPARLQQRDAELLRYELNCNMVRCSHYPQSPHFLDACDRVGLMVWEEAPGWRYVGDPGFEQGFLSNVRDMVVRDRNRPSVIVWGTRLDETEDFETLYAQARELAHAYDGTRQTTGAMATQSTTGWAEDLFAYDDYSPVSNGAATLKPPLTSVPYMVSEAVGALVGAPLYRWIDATATLQLQAQLHAQVHQLAGASPHYAGLLAWCGIDYASLTGGTRTWESLKWPGVLDTFRVPKPGASVYRTQVSPAAAPLIIPAFYWDFGPSSPPSGPGPGAMIATNCDRLELYLNGAPLTSAVPDRVNYGNLPFPPAFVDLTVSGAGNPLLRIDGFLSGKLVTSLSMSSDPASDRLVLALQDTSIAGDGIDASRATFRALDAYGNQRPYVQGDVTLSLRGPAQLIGQTPFAFALYGGVGGAFVRSRAGRHGTVTLTASHPTLGHAQAKLRVIPAGGRYL
jgi:beta-galactosidase